MSLLCFVTVSLPARVGQLQCIQSTEVGVSTIAIMQLLFTLHFSNFISKKYRIQTMSLFCFVTVVLPARVGQLQCIKSAEIWVCSVAIVHFLLLLHSCNFISKKYRIQAMSLFCFVTVSSASPGRSVAMHQEHGGGREYDCHHAVVVYASFFQLHQQKVQDTNNESVLLCHGRSASPGRSIAMHQECGDLGVSGCHCAFLASSAFSQCHHEMHWDNKNETAPSIPCLSASLGMTT